MKELMRDLFVCSGCRSEPKQVMPMESSKKNSKSSRPEKLSRKAPTKAKVMPEGKARTKAKGRAPSKAKAMPAGDETRRMRWRMRTRSCSAHTRRRFRGSGAR
jgi:hypothetical protein